MQHWPQAGQLYDGRSLQSIGGGRWCCRCRWCCARRWGLLLAPSAMPANSRSTSSTSAALGGAELQPGRLAGWAGLRRCLG